MVPLQAKITAIVGDHRYNIAYMDGTQKRAVRGELMMDLRQVCAFVQSSRRTHCIADHGYYSHCAICIAG